MTTILDRIKAYKLEEVAARKAQRSLHDLEEAANAAPAPRGFARALTEAAQSGYGLIAEIKKASPSKGLIRADFDPPALAAPMRPGGHLPFGPDRRSQLPGGGRIPRAGASATNLPCIRKDFIYDPYQITEARGLHADCILLIMASLSDSQAQELEDAAFAWGMDVLIEVHDEAELDRTARLKSPLIGINNRNLHTFEVTLDTTRNLARRVPEDRLIVAESGLYTADDLADLARYGARCFLIGESLMRQKDVEAATRAILTRPLTGQR